MIMPSGILRCRSGAVWPVAVDDRHATVAPEGARRDLYTRGGLPALVLAAVDELDPILKGYIEEDLSPEELVAAGNKAETVARVIQLVDRSEYKRRQAPPGVKITPRAFGRDRRMPIVNRYSPNGVRAK